MIDVHSDILRLPYLAAISIQLDLFEASHKWPLLYRLFLFLALI